MNNLNVKFDNMEQSQKKLNKKLNQLEAESKLVLYILEAINKKGMLTNER
jgi:flagellar basal body P-ring protein FlgI